MKKAITKFPEKTKDYEKRHAPKKVAPKRTMPVQPPAAKGRPDIPLAATPEPQMMM